MNKFSLILLSLFFYSANSQTFSSFTTAGNQSQYVPVSFKSITSDGGNRTFFITRNDIHEGRDWLAHGIVAITGIGYGWGSGGNGLRVDNFTYGYETTNYSKIVNFLGRVMTANATNDIIVFLRGGTKYYYTNAVVVSNTGAYQDAAGLSLGSVSINDPFYNLPKGTYYGSGDINGKTSNFAAIDNGNVGIGVSNPVNKLDVNGIVHAREVKVDLQNWPDYVFENQYRLNTLEEVEKHIRDKGHLPNIPSAEEVIRKGINLGEMNVKLLEKIEELTLYSIEQNKQLKVQSDKIEKLEKQLEQLVSDKNNDHEKKITFPILFTDRIFGIFPNHSVFQI
ncbi:hypothetical protein [Chryseobacterium sp.]|uniref:hypothetical protein n=1 Tax=Chryseobacterium sp. TaxID=1871047 RepID=UPI0025BDF529|nr:hypothetical protein [Chryseobacterium sp.]